ncbi:MAG: calcium-binding protein [Moorea sp. SIO4E2]|uniref:calcium-binding protein n=1 Tax=Moorena sp. SIO4E2 TaxID=2607826 RepID=UPI0013BD5280|nr:calcium-binding protein [Moorena sp. SIO4E2]NEQ05915.1 calcium-binding protein [Moorena sp. SIO4E2]
MSSIVADPDLEVIPTNEDGFVILGPDDKPVFVDGSDGLDVIQTGDGTDEVSGGDGDDVLLGQAGDDQITGDEGDDVVLGGAGNDNLIIGPGTDVAIGGPGHDTFTFEFFDNQPDIITEFNSGEDRIVIPGVDDQTNVTYDSITGELKVDGETIAQLSSGLDVEINKTDDGFEIL